MKIARLTLTILLVCFSLAAQTSPDKATVYFYCIEEVNALDSRATKVKIDGKPFFDIKEKRFIAFQMPPGKYILRQRQKQSEFLLNVEAGKTYYVSVVHPHI